MANVTDELLKLESELFDMLNQTSSLKKQVGDYALAKDSLIETRNRLGEVIQSLTNLVNKEYELIKTIRETSPDKILEQMTQSNNLSEQLRKEVENLDEEFIAVKDAIIATLRKTEENMRQQNDASKTAIIQAVNDLYDKYQLMSDKLYVADEKIIIGQERFQDGFKKHEETVERFKNETDVLVKDSAESLRKIIDKQSCTSRKHFKIIIFVVTVSILLSIINLIIFFKK